VLSYTYEYLINNVTHVFVCVCMKCRCLALSFTVPAWICSVITVAVCDFTDGIYSRYGLFRSCYSGQMVGSGHVTAKVFGLICCILGGIVLVIMTLGLFLPLPVSLWRTVKFSFRVLAPFQLFTFAIFNSCPEDHVCAIGTGAKSALLAFMFWILAVIFSEQMPMVKKAVIPSCNNSGGGCCNDAGGGCGCCDQPSTEAVEIPVSVESCGRSAPPAPGTTTIAEEFVHPV